MTPAGHEPEATPGAERFKPTRRPESETHPDEDDVRVRVEAAAQARLERTVEELRSCLADAELIVSHGRERFEDDPLLRRAAKNVLTELAETAGRLPQRWIDERTDVAWHSIRGMRNRLVHAYEHTDYDVVWNTLTIDCAELRDHVIDNQQR